MENLRAIFSQRETGIAMNAQGVATARPVNHNLDMQAQKRRRAFQRVMGRKDRGPGNAALDSRGGEVI